MISSLGQNRIMALSSLAEASGTVKLHQVQLATRRSPSPSKEGKRDTNNVQVHASIHNR